MKAAIFAKLLHSALIVASLTFFLLCIRLGFLTNDIYVKMVMPPLLAYLVVAIFRRLFFVSGALIDKLQSVRRQEDHQFDVRPMVSVLVPCFNEEQVLADSLRSLMQLKYPSFEIIVIDDGSTDRTAVVAQTVVQESPLVPIRVITKPNGGKASALNLGVQNAIGDFVLCVDADSRIHPDSLEAGIVHFMDPKVGAVAGFVEVDNQDKWLGFFQEYEYLVGLNFLRRGLAIMGIVPVIPGPAGLFRRTALASIKGYVEARDLMAEDAELSLRLVAAGWRIKSEEDLIAYTEAPEDWSSLYRQRYRWNRGVFQAWRKNFLSLIDWGGWRGFVLSTQLFFEIYIVTVVNFGMMLMFCTHFIVRGDTALLTKWFVGILVMEAITTALVTFRHPGYLKWLTIAMVGQFSYSPALMVWRVYNLFEEWINLSMSWDKIDRLGHLKSGGTT